MYTPTLIIASILLSGVFSLGSEKREKGRGGDNFWGAFLFNHLVHKSIFQVLREKLGQYKPKIAVFNGKAIYEVYSGQKKFMFGRQPEPLNDGATWLWVMPSSSARCAQLPRAVDKVPFFEALRKFRDYLTGRLPKIEDCEVVFANVSLRNWTSNNAIKTEPQAASTAASAASAAENGGQSSEVNPNLQPYTDGVPANVPASVTEVIEDVIKQYSEEDDSSASASSPNE